MIDGLRAVAACSVVVYHAGQFAHAEPSLIGGFVAHLDAGVAVFFVITGFLLYRPYLAALRGGRPALSVRAFYWRRALRIVPAYWIALLVLSPTLTFAAPHGLPNYAFAQIYSPGDWSLTGIGPAWSVCVEVSFYLLLPWFARLVHAGGRPSDARVFGTLLVLALACMEFRHWVRGGDRLYTWFLLLPATLLWFALGMALAVVSTSSGPRIARVRAWVAGQPLVPVAAAGAIFFACGLTDNYGGEASDALFLAYGAIAVLLVGAAAFAGDRALPLLGRRDVAWLGLISYGIYLYHHPLMAEFRQHVHVERAGFNLVIYGAFGLTVSIACGAASYYLVERRALRLKRMG